MASVVPISQLAGPMLIGLCLNWGLFGCATVQLYYYSCFFPKDRPALKALVYGICLWETVQTCMITQPWYENLVYGWGDRAKLNAIGTSWFGVPFMSAVSGMVVQCFYAWRVFKLGRSYPLAVFIVSLSLMAGASGIALSVIMTTLPDISLLQQKTNVVDGIWLWGSASCDTIISLSMLTYLARARNNNSIRKTESLLTRLIRLTVGAGIATGLVAIVDGVMFIKFKHNNYHMIPVSMLGKLYTNSFLVLMNSRRTQRDIMMTTSVDLWGTDYTQSHGRSIPIQHSSFSIPGQHPAGVAVRVDQEHESHSMGPLSQLYTQDSAAFADIGGKIKEADKDSQSV